MAIFSEQDKQRIEARVAAAEQGTAAEIVVATVPRSDSYLDVRIISALVFAVGTSAALHLLLTLHGVGELLLVQLTLGALGFGLTSSPGLLRKLLTPRRVHAMVQREAELRFLEHAVFATRDRNGVLILVSELEHNVTILGDRGIHARVKGEGWTEHVQTIIKAIREGRAAEGVCQVIDALAQTLKELEPIRDGDTNELDNRVRSH